MSVPVYVNIYRLIPSGDKSGQVSNDALEFIKMGIYHAGVEIFGQEYSFGMDPSNSGDPNKDGVFVVRPRSAAGEFKEQVKLGDVSLDKPAFDRLLNEMRPEWRAISYHILKHNCCYFSEALALRLNPAFANTFPKYVYKAAGVGGAVVPDAVVSSLTKALAPPASVPTHLINQIDAPGPATAPKPGAARGGGGGGGGGVFGMAKGLVDKAKAAVGKDDASACVAKFPDTKPDDVTANFGCHVCHIRREQYADVFVTKQGLCFIGENKLSLRLPWAKIASLSYGVKKAPAAGTLLPTFDVSASKPSAEGCLLVFTADNKMIPLFSFTGFGQTLAAALGKVTGNTTDEKLEKAFDAVDEAWHKK